MPIDLDNEIRAALAGACSHHPVATETLAKGHHRRRVEAALMRLYAAREVCCCKIIKGGIETVLWWMAGNTRQLPRYDYGQQKGRVL